MRIPTPLLAFAVVVGLFGLPGVMAGPASAAGDPRQQAVALAVEAGIAVEVVPSALGIVEAGGDLTVSVVVANRTSETLAPGTATLYLDRSPVDGRNALSRWLRGDTDGDGALADRGESVGTVAAPELFPGESRALPPIVVAAESLGFDDESEFGARRLSVVLAAGDAHVEGRSSITVDPGPPTVTAPTTDPPIETAPRFEATALSIAAPIALPSSPEGTIPSAMLETYTAPGGLLSRQLDQALGRPVALGVDPRIIASIRLLGDSAPESATQWLARLASAPNETFALSYADTDIAATSQAGGGVLAPTGIPIDPDLFTAEGEVQEEASPGPTPSATPAVPETPTLESLLAWNYTTTGIAWPRDGSVVASDLEAFAAAGLTTTILTSSNATSPEAEPNPGAAATISEHEALTSDRVISTLLREAVEAPSTMAWESAMARLASSLATLSVEDAGRSGPVLATLGRDEALGGFRLSETIAALDSLEWSTPAPLEAARAASPVERVVVDSPVGAEQIARLEAMLGSERAIVDFATITDDPTVLTEERRLSLLALASQSWTPSDPNWAAAVETYLAESAEILSSVRVETGTITQWSDSGPLPITISNALGIPVTVFVTVESSTAILDVRASSVKVTIAPNSQNRASIPVESVANGKVVITIYLQSEAGVPISQPTQAEITVQAGWETAATTVLAALILAVFVLGILRTIRRRRRPAAEGAAHE